MGFLLHFAFNQSCVSHQRKHVHAVTLRFLYSDGPTDATRREMFDTKFDNLPLVTVMRSKRTHCRSVTEEQKTGSTVDAAKAAELRRLIRTERTREQLANSQS